MAANDGENPDPGHTRREPSDDHVSGRGRTDGLADGLNARRAEFEDTHAEGSKNAERAGRDAARNLGAGFLQGLGRRFAEKVWDIVSDQLG